MRITKNSDRQPSPDVSTLPGLVRCATLGLGLVAMALTGCKGGTSATNPADGTTASNQDGQNSPDPTQANMAPVDQTTTLPASSTGSTKVAGYQQQAQPTQQSYTNRAPVERRTPSSTDQSNEDSNQAYNQGPPDSNYPGQTYNDDDYNAESGYNATLEAVTAPQSPPPLPAYEQPEAPEPNYLWTPGYWNYAPQGYYWVPGAWVQPPYTGALWTPGYWGGAGNGYRYHHGFWASHIGFYGGINYGFGYFGSGYQGGYWNGDNFYYNRQCNRVDEHVVRNVYQRNVVINNSVVKNTTINNTTINNTTINNVHYNNVSYNGGLGGVQVQPRPAELAVLREQRVPPMHTQVEHQQQAAQNRQQFFVQNQGRPALVAALRPLPADHGIVAPLHTTAQINRSLPVQQQLQQQRQFARLPAANSIGRPTITPNQANPPIERNQLNRAGTNQPNSSNRFEPVPQQRQSDPMTQPNRPGFVKNNEAIDQGNHEFQRQNRPTASPIQARPPSPQPQSPARPQVRQAPPQTIRAQSQPLPQSVPEQPRQTQRVPPQQQQPQQARPPAPQQSQQARPPVPQQPRPQTQPEPSRPLVQQQSRPQTPPQPHPQPQQPHPANPQPQPHPQPHGRG